MGNQLSGIAPTQILPVESYFADLPNIRFDSSLGTTRFLKVARANAPEGLVVVKVFAIHDQSLPLKQHADKIEDICSRLKDVVNCCNYEKVLFIDRAAVLIRQYVKDSLYDRLSTRPFLNAEEKKWVTFQLLLALRDIHALDVCHGDIKLENVMITSWNWVILTDFATFKPTSLPVDNPSDHSYFFDTSRRRTCYIAPERFVDRKMTDEDLMGNDQNSLLDQVDMQLLPSMDVFAAGCTLVEFLTEGSPPFIYSQLLDYRLSQFSPTIVLNGIEDPFLKELMERMISRDSADRPSAAACLEEYQGKIFPDYFYSFLWPYMKKFTDGQFVMPDERIDQIKTDFPVILRQMKANIGNWEDEAPAYHPGYVIILSLVTSCIRGLTVCGSKLRALELLRELSALVNDEIIFDRMLPYIFFMTKDCFPRVRAVSIEVLTHCLTCVHSVPSTEDHIFLDYILPGIQSLVKDPSVCVRVSLAQHIGQLALLSEKFLDKTITISDEDTDIPTSSISLYDFELNALQVFIQPIVSTILTDHENSVKQTLLEHGISKLCVFFGKLKASDAILSHVITFLNDKEDKNLRAAFFRSIVGIATCIGSQCTQILHPLMIQGLGDSEEFVIVCAINTMTMLAKLGLLQKETLCDLISNTAPFLVHPNVYIRHAVAGFLCCSYRILDIVESLCKIMPSVKKYLKHPIIQLDNEAVLLGSLTPCIPRLIYDQILKSQSIKPVIQILQKRNLNRVSIKQDYRSREDEVPLSLKNLFTRLRSDGLNDEIEDHLLSLGDHLIKIHKHCYIAHAKSQSKDVNGEIDLNKLKLAHISRKADLTQNQKFDAQLSKPKPVRRGVWPEPVMNEEWQHMFGMQNKKMEDLERESHSGGDKTDTDASTGPDEASDMNSSQPQDTADRNTNDPTFVQYHGIPCKIALQKLIKQKSDQYFRDVNYQKHLRDMSWEFNLIPSQWTPKGILVAHLREHRASITRLTSISKPNQFSSRFATASNDGYVRIWDFVDVGRKSIVNSSKLAYNKMESPVVSVSYCSESASLLCASEKGQIHVVNFGASNKLTLKDSRTLDPDEEGHVVDFFCMPMTFGHVVVYSTIYGSIVGWDLRAPSNAFLLSSPKSQGLVTAMCGSHHQSWIVVGTSSGIMTCWDLRFQIPISTIVSGSGGARLMVRRLYPHPTEKSWVIASIQGNNEVSMYNIETQTRCATLWGGDNPPLSYTKYSSRTVNGMFTSGAAASPFLITGGTDMRLRYWNLENLKDSYIFAKASNDEAKYKKIIAEYNSRLIDGVEVTVEKLMKERKESSDTGEAVEDRPKRGPDLPCPGHSDAITDVILLGGPQWMIVSSSRDGVVKVWK